MIDEIKQNFPIFFNAGSKSKWEELNSAANSILGYGNELANTYSNPMLDQNGDYWFIVNQEVSSLVDLSLCKNYDEILFNTSSI